ncbi:MAG TPA: hypothetical protein VGM18_16625 [Candidatus Sulfotelmatobacter sp.]|jgi:uncharacterized protein YfeS
MRKVGILLLAVSMATACSSAPKFSQADVQKTEADIRAKLEQKGFIVEQVSMIRDSDRHMSGFAKTQVKQTGLLHTKLVEVNKNCTATMDESTNQFIWECK